MPPTLKCFSPWYLLSPDSILCCLCVHYLCLPTWRIWVEERYKQPNSLELKRFNDKRRDSICNPFIWETRERGKQGQGMVGSSRDFLRCKGRSESTGARISVKRNFKHNEDLKDVWESRRLKYLEELGSQRFLLSLLKQVSTESWLYAGRYGETVRAHCDIWFS